MDSGIVQGFTEQRLFGIACLDGSRPNIGQANTCILDVSIAIKRDIGSYAGNGIITDFALKLEIRATAFFGRSGNTNLS